MLPSLLEVGVLPILWHQAQMMVTVELWYCQYSHKQTSDRIKQVDVGGKLIQYCERSFFASISSNVDVQWKILFCDSAILNNSVYDPVSIYGLLDRIIMTVGGVWPILFYLI